MQTQIILFCPCYLIRNPFLHNKQSNMQMPVSCYNNIVRYMNHYCNKRLIQYSNNSYSSLKIQPLKNFRGTHSYPPKYLGRCNLIQPRHSIAKRNVSSLWSFAGMTQPTLSMTTPSGCYYIAMARIAKEEFRYHIRTNSTQHHPSGEEDSIP